MYTKHAMEECLYPSQRKRVNKTKEQFTIVDKRRIRELDFAVLNCIIQDGRSFGDFSKPGMLKFLEIAIPGKNLSLICINCLTNI